MKTYKELLEERKIILIKLKEAAELEQRLHELNDDNWGRRQGLISKAKQKEEEEKSPIFEFPKNSFDKILRIMSVDKKWITLKRDGSNGVIRYKIENGWQERSRDGYHAIDVEKALKIWSEYNEQH